MKEKSLELSVLYDFYGALLTDKQRAIFDMYYNEDLSLSEIAENEGITRQGVRDAIKHGEATLQDLEDRLGVARKETAMQADLERLQQLVTEVTETSVTIQAQEARNKKLIENFFRKEREGIRVGRQSSKAAYDYYKNMNRSSVVPPQFMDSKK